MSKQQRTEEDLDFIICLSFHKLQEQNHHSLLPFVLIRNALTAQPSPSFQQQHHHQQQQQLVFSKPLLEQHEHEQDEQQREQSWLDACFDDLNRQEEEEDVVMEDDFGDMLFHASIQRAKVNHSQSLSRHLHRSKQKKERYHLSPFFFPLDQDQLENKHDPLVNHQDNILIIKEKEQTNTLS